MNSTEAVERMIAVLDKAEAAADKAQPAKAEAYIKIADQWNDVAWQIADFEVKARAEAAKAAKNG